MAEETRAELSPEAQRLLDEIRELKELGRKAGTKPGHRSHHPAKGRVRQRRTRVKIR